MADPRLDALLRSITGGPGGTPEEEMEGEQTPSNDDPMAEAVGQAMSILEPFMDDPRIAQAASMLQEVAAGPAEMPADSNQMEAAGPMPQ